MKKIIITALCLTLCAMLLCGCGTKAEVVVEGSTEKLSASDICDYESKYKGAEITVTGKITKIEGPYYVNTEVPYYYEYKVTIDGSWVVKISENDSSFSSLNIGDNVTAKGNIESAFVYVTICGWNDEKGYNSNYSKITKN